VPAAAVEDVEGRQQQKHQDALQDTGSRHTEATIPEGNAYSSRTKATSLQSMSEESNMYAGSKCLVN
jgi:hypothetical protein